MFHGATREFTDGLRKSQQCFKRVAGNIKEDIGGVWGEIIFLGISQEGFKGLQEYSRKFQVEKGS